MNVETGKTTTIPVANTPFGEPCFTPDGASLVYRQLRAKQRDARVAALLVFALDKGKAFRIQGGETSHYETGYSGIEFSTHGCLLTTESWNDEGRLTSSGWWEYPAPSRERTVFNRRDVPDRVILEWYESLYKAGRKGHYVAGSTDGSRVLYGDSAAARVLLDSAEEKDNRWRGRDHVWHFATAEMEGILGMNSEGSRLARLGPDRRIRLWDVDRAKEAPLLQTLGWCNVPFAPDSKEDPRPVIACDWTAVAAVTSAAGNRALYCWTLLQRVDSPERPKCRLSIGAVAIRGGVVWQVPPSTPAAAGLQVGDKIYALEHDERNRDTVHSDADLARALENCVPGHTVTLRIDRDKKEIQLEVTPIVIDASPAGQ